MTSGRGVDSRTSLICIISIVLLTIALLTTGCIAREGDPPAPFEIEGFHQDEAGDWWIAESRPRDNKLYRYDSTWDSSSEEQPPELFYDNRYRSIQFDGEEWLTLTREKVYQFDDEWGFESVHEFQQDDEWRADSITASDGNKWVLASTPYYSDNRTTFRFDDKWHKQESYRLTDGGGYEEIVRAPDGGWLLSTSFNDYLKVNEYDEDWNFVETQYESDSEERHATEKGSVSGLTTYEDEIWGITSNPWKIIRHGEQLRENDTVEQDIENVIRNPRDFHIKNGTVWVLTSVNVERFELGSQNSTEVKDLEPDESIRDTWVTDNGKERWFLASDSSTSTLVKEESGVLTEWIELHSEYEALGLHVEEPHIYVGVEERGVGVEDGQVHVYDADNPTDPPEKIDVELDSVKGITEHEDRWYLLGVNNEEYETGVVNDDIQVSSYDEEWNAEEKEVDFDDENQYRITDLEIDEDGDLYIIHRRSDKVDIYSNDPPFVDGVRERILGDGKDWVHVDTETEIGKAVDG